MINEEQWKLEHSKRTESLSFFTIVGIIVIVLIVCVLLCLCCCKCFKCWPCFRNWFGRQGSCHTILFKPKIITKIHNSNESYHGLRVTQLSQVARTAEETELVTFVSPSSSKFRKVSNNAPATDRR